MASQSQYRGAVMITGASTGIGKACAMRLDRLGFQVFAGVRKDADGGALVETASERLTPVLIDVTDETSIASAADIVAKAVGDEGLAGLVNNAGIAVPGPLEFMPLGDLRHQMEVNSIGQIAVTQAFLPLLRKCRGRIVNIGSIAGRSVTPFVGAYAASKFAMEAFTDALRMELRPWGISVSIVEPGSIATPIWNKGTATADDLEKKLSKEAHDLYDPAMAALRKATNESARRAIPPASVAKAVTHALTAERPKTRYLVGRDAQIRAALAKVLPDRMQDWLVARFMGLPKGG